MLFLFKLIFRLLHNYIQIFQILGKFFLQRFGKHWSFDLKQNQQVTTLYRLKTGYNLKKLFLNLPLFFEKITIQDTSRNASKR